MKADVRSLIERIKNDPDSTADLTPEQLAEVRRAVNPLGGTQPTKKRAYACMSLINWRDRYMRRLHTTALIGYLFRTLDEYEPDYALERENDYHDKLMEAVSLDTSLLPAERTSKQEQLMREHAQRSDAIKNTTKGIIERFLYRNFAYNPDYHLRQATDENPTADCERKTKAQLIAECDAARNSLPGARAFIERTDNAFEFLKASALGLSSAAAEAERELKAALGVLIDPKIAPADKHGILFKKLKVIREIHEQLRDLAAPFAAEDCAGAIKAQPPAEMYHQYDRYLTNHYETLKALTESLYAEKTDFEFAAILYDTFKTADAAREYMARHNSEFRCDVFTLESGGVSLLGPFKENRARVDFYNKNTEIMKQMMEQVETDHKLGKDLMQKRVKKEKAKNIREAGPDAPGLAEYAKAMNQVAALGAKKGLSKEEMRELEAAKLDAQRRKEDYEIPDDAIQVDMFYTDERGDFQRNKFYTRAEPPLFMEEGSPWRDKYMPVDENPAVSVETDASIPADSASDITEKN